MRPVSDPPIPYQRLRTIFLDVGNTLISMDYGWIRDELAGHGVEVDLETLMRAEAAARPTVSRAVAGEASTEGRDVFTLYLSTVVRRLLPITGLPRLNEIVDAMLPVLRDSGKTRLWSHVLPGVPQALARLRALGLELAVVSNSNGTVEQVLADRGLRDCVGAVFDSRIVGYEKPDPRLFAHALDRTGATAETTLHVGDLYAADIVGGRAAGIHTALLDPYGDWEDVDCHRFRNLNEVSETIRANVIV